MTDIARERLETATVLASDRAGLAVVATTRADGTIQSSMVNVGLLAHPVTGVDVLGFITYGAVKLANMRARPHVAITFSRGWQWATVEGTAQLIGPDEPGTLIAAEALRRLRRDVFIAAGGTHDDWDEYDRVMDEQRRVAVLVRPTRAYG